MAITTALRLELANRPGELAKALRPMAQAGVNLHAVACLGSAESCVLAALPNDPAAAARALQRAGLQVQQVAVVVSWLPNRPGTLLAACEALGTAGINIDGVFVVATDPAQGVQLSFACRDADAERAEHVLAGLLA